MYQDGLRRERGTPEWYSIVNKQDSALITQWNSSLYELGQYPDRYALTEATVIGLDVEQNERESEARVRRSYEGLRFGLYFSYGQTR